MRCANAKTVTELIAAVRTDESAAAAVQLVNELDERDLDGEIRDMPHSRLPKFQYLGLWVRTGETARDEMGDLRRWAD